MVKIPERTFDFRVRGSRSKVRNDIGVDVQYPWEDSARRFHEHSMRHTAVLHRQVSSDERGVQEALSMRAQYRPKDDVNFLRDWKDGTYPSGVGQQTRDLGLTRRCSCIRGMGGKAASSRVGMAIRGAGNRRPRLSMGQRRGDAEAVPVPDQSRTMRGPDSVDAHPAGASPFGVMDLVGNVWQWTDEYLDEHTRAAILRGGSYYQPQGSIWYFPQAYRN